MTRERTEAKVKAYNRAAKRALELYDSLSEVFKKFVGEKILKVDGSFLVKVSNFIPFMENKPEIQIYRHQSKYSLVWVVKASEQVQGQSFVEYMEVSVYVGELDGDVLKSICAKPNLRHNFTIEEVIKKQEDVKAAQAKLDAARSAIHPFGE